MRLSLYDTLTKKKAQQLLIEGPAQYLVVIIIYQ